MRSIRRVCALAAAILAAALPVSAQITTGSVAGTVKDSQGGVVPGATVVLISEARGTRSAPATTSSAGDFVFPNVTVDTYTIEVTMPSFSTLKRTGVPVSAGSRVTVGTLTIDPGGAKETVEVKAEAPVIQAASGERSFTIPTESVQNLPILNRSFHTLATLARASLHPIIASRAGVDHQHHDGRHPTLDTGSNSVMLQMNTSRRGPSPRVGLQAEPAGTAASDHGGDKSGTNRFRGSVYERNTSWNANSRTNILNGTPKTISKQKDWGY